MPRHEDEMPNGRPASQGPRSFPRPWMTQMTPTGFQVVDDNGVVMFAVNATINTETYPDGLSLDEAEMIALKLARMVNDAPAPAQRTENRTQSHNGQAQRSGSRRSA